MTPEETEIQELRAIIEKLGNENYRLAQSENRLRINFNALMKENFNLKANLRRGYIPPAPVSFF